MDQLRGQSWHNHEFYGLDIIYFLNTDNVIAGKKQQFASNSGDDIHHVSSSSAGGTWQDNAYRSRIYTTRGGSLADFVQEGCYHSCHVLALSNLQTTWSTSLPNMQQMYQWYGPSLSVDEQLRRSQQFQ